MPRSIRGTVRATGLLTAILLFGVPLAGCSDTSAGNSTASTTQGDQDMELQAIYDAVAASDPRVEDPLGTVSSSGAAKTLSLSVLIVGDEPVSTETLTAVLVAARDSTSDDIETITLVAREAADEEKIVDLSSAIAGLPEGITALWDGGVTLARVDLDKL